MSCETIKMPDGTVVLANVVPGQKLTEADKQALAEWVQFCRNRRAREQRRRDAAAELRRSAKGAEGPK